VEDAAEEEAEAITLEDGTVITPWEVRGPQHSEGSSNGRANKDIDYEAYVQRIGASMVDDALMERWRKATGESKLHTFVRRGVFFAHRDLEHILEKYESWKSHREEVLKTAAAEGTTAKPPTAPPFYLYTGRGPSSDSMHVGHLVPFMFAKYL
jgi:tryptophanyl-tRNA synthetase